MVRLLIIVSIASFVLCLACFTVVSALGGAELARNGWNWNWAHAGRWDGDWDHDRRDRHARLDWTGPIVTRDIAFTGAPELEVDVPADITYLQAPQGRLSITGPKDVVDRVEVVNGEIRLRDGSWRNHRRSQRLTISVAAPDTKSFVLHGSQTLAIENYQQPSLDIDLAGSGSVTARGASDSVDIDIAGSGEADLSGLELNHARVDVAGSGDITMGPKLSADIDIAGSGDVTLLTRPPQLQTDIAGSGDIHMPDDDAPTTPAPPAPAAPPAKAAPPPPAKPGAPT